MLKFHIYLLDYTMTVQSLLTVSLKFYVKANYIKFVCLVCNEYYVASMFQGIS